MTSQNSHEQQFQSAWNALDQVEHHPQIATWLREADNASSIRQARSALRLRRLRWATAAAITLLLIGVSIFVYRRPFTEAYQTRIGEQRELLLSDGSKVTLNTNTAVRVHYSKERRHLILERGEALFTVVHNIARPFDVEASGTLTRAVGTQFNVDIRSSKVTVSVLEGTVRVSTPDSLADSGGPALSGDAAPRTEALTKGEALEFHPKEHVLIAAKANLGRIDSWRTQRMEFSDSPLSEAVEEFNRYSSLPIVIGTPALADRRVSWVFHTGDADAFLYSLREVLNIDSHDVAGKVVLTQR